MELEKWDLGLQGGPPVRRSISKMIEKTILPERSSEVGGESLWLSQPGNRVRFVLFVRAVRSCAGERFLWLVSSRFKRPRISGGTFSRFLRFGIQNGLTVPNFYTKSMIFDQQSQGFNQNR